jgi:hypothetical protein
MLTLFLLITLLHVSMRKNHHQGFSLYTNLLRLSLYAKLLTLIDLVILHTKRLPDDDDAYASKHVGV